MPEYPPAPPPDVAPSWCNGYGHGEDAAIPDTPWEVWLVEIEAVLGECAQRRGRHA